MSVPSASVRPGAEMPRRLSFGRFEIHARERLLLIDGEPASVGARAFDLLLALAQRPGQLVTKHELLDLVWPGLVVEEANLAVQVSTLRKLLGGDVIATIPGRGYRFVAAMHAAQALAPAAAELTSPAPVALPPAAPRLVGREDDLGRLAAALKAGGCITLIGPPGVGKTSLAGAFASQWPQGAIWVDLASLMEGAQVQGALARALELAAPGANAAAALIHALGSRLLVLDNAEHLIDATAALVTELLRAAPGLPLLVTSQLPLVVSNEHVHRIEPLAMPLDSDALDLNRGAIALFVERARAADHHFHAGPEALPLLREICRRLDGLPLALEMAAARVPSLGLSGVRDALQTRFALLSGGRRGASARHRTLDAALQWSYALLARDEQQLFRSFSVFAGGFTLELAAAVAAAAADQRHDRWAVIDGLSVLVERSLVTTDRSEPPRYRLLETMRAYAADQLAAAGDEPALRRHHARAMRDLFVRAAASDATEAQTALARAEHDNVREALAWAVAHEPALAVELAPAVAAVATFTPWRREALAWLQACEAVIADPGIAPERRAAWWLERARQMAINRDPQAGAVAGQARELCLALGDDLGVFCATSAIVRSSTAPNENLREWCAQMQTLLERHPQWPLKLSLMLEGTMAFACDLLGDLEGMLGHRLKELELARRCGAAASADAAETNVVYALQQLGRHEEALARNEELLARLDDSESGNAAYAWENHIALLIGLGRFGEVRKLAPRAAAVLRRFDLPHLSDQMALMLALERQPRTAARLIGHAHQAYESRGLPLEGAYAANLARAQTLVREGLDEPTYARLVAEGHALDDAAMMRLLQAGCDGG